MGTLGNGRGVDFPSALDAEGILERWAAHRHLQGHGASSRDRERGQYLCEGCWNAMTDTVLPNTETGIDMACCLACQRRREPAMSADPVDALLSYLLGAEEVDMAAIFAMRAYCDEPVTSQQGEAVPAPALLSIRGVATDIMPEG